MLSARECRTKADDARAQAAAVADPALRAQYEVHADQWMGLARAALFQDSLSEAPSFQAHANEPLETPE